MQRAVVLMSGGLKSAAIAADLKHRGYEVLGVHAHYGQRSQPNETLALQYLVKQIGMTLETMPLPAFAEAESPSRLWPILNKEKPADQITPHVHGLMNVMMLMAVLHADRFGANEIYIGWCNIDGNYPDATPGNLNAVNEMIRTAFASGTKVYAPFMLSHQDKAIKTALMIPQGDRLFRLAISCLDGKLDQKCGSCRGCKVRASAFKNANVRDPAAWEPGEIRAKKAAEKAKEPEVVKA